LEALKDVLAMVIFWFLWAVYWDASKALEPTLKKGQPTLCSSLVNFCKKMGGLMERNLYGREVPLYQKGDTRPWRKQQYLPQITASSLSVLCPTSSYMENIREKRK